MRTELPTISITWTTMSSPSMIFSPGRRVMMQHLGSSLECFEKAGAALGEARAAA